jgi:hypothetical protein
MTLKQAYYCKELWGIWTKTKHTLAGIWPNFPDQQLFAIKSCRFWDNVEKYCTTRRTTGDKWIRVAWWITKATETYSEYVTLIAFPWQKMFLRMCLNVTFKCTFVAYVISTLGLKYWINKRSTHMIYVRHSSYVTFWWYVDLHALHGELPIYMPAYCFPIMKIKWND